MKIFLTSIGTRGDIEPFLALGEILSKCGHDLIFSFPIQFEKLLPENSKFHPLTPEFLKLIDSEEGSTVMGNAHVFKKARALYILYKKGRKVNTIIVNQHHKALRKEQPELIVHHPKCAMPFLWSLMTGTKIITYSPVPYVLHPVSNHPAIGFPFFKNLTYIKLSYKIARYAWVKQIYDAQSSLDKKVRFSKYTINDKLYKSKFIFGVSPQLFQRPKYWNEHIQVLGHHERQSSRDYKPSKELEDFLNTNEKILFLSFGSMINDSPEKNSECFYDVITQLKIPCIVNTSSGGLLKIERYTQFNFYFVEDLPYDWLFKHVYAVIHHGGSGTTHMGIKHGLPTLIIPHIIDQFMWNRLISERGLGPKGMSINKVNSKNLKTLIEGLYRKEKFKKNAEEIAEKINSENLDEKLIKYITD